MEQSTKLARESRTIMTQLIFPLDTNHFDTMFGGKLMEYMDKVAAISAMRHARMQAVTASTDSLDFWRRFESEKLLRLKPLFRGHIAARWKCSCPFNPKICSVGSAKRQLLLFHFCCN